jgi:hypothetical protein
LDWIAARARNFVEFARRNQWDQKCRRVVNAVTRNVALCGKSVSNWIAAQRAAEPAQKLPIAVVAASVHAGSILTAQPVTNQMPTVFPVASGSLGLLHTQDCWYCRRNIPSGSIQCPYCRMLTVT